MNQIDVPNIPLSLVHLSGVTDPADCWPRCYDVDDAGTIVPVEAVSADGINPSAATFDVNQCPHCGTPMDADERSPLESECWDCISEGMAIVMKAFEDQDIDRGLP